MSGFTGLKDSNTEKSCEYERVSQVYGSKHQILLKESHTGPHAGVSHNDIANDIIQSFDRQ